MSTQTEFVDATLTQVRDVLNRLESEIPDCPTLLELLSSPLASIGLLPPKYKRYVKEPIPTGSINIQRHIPRLQETILTKIITIWEENLREQDGLALIEQYFCPDAFSNASPAAGAVTLRAYATILALPLTDYSIGILTRLARAYPIDRLHASVALACQHEGQEQRALAWEDCVRSAVAVPAKVANALGAQRKPIPLELEQGPYFNNLSMRCEELMFRFSVATTSSHGGAIPGVVFLLTKLANLGVFPSSSSVPPSQPSFFRSTSHEIRERLNGEHSAAYSQFWNDTFNNLPSFFTSQTILTSLLLSLFETGLDSTPEVVQRATIKQEACLLRRLVGNLHVDQTELWQLISTILLRREWSSSHGRLLVCWTSMSPDHEHALDTLIHRILDVWASPEHIKHSLLSHHQYLTSLLLVTVSYFPPSSPQLQTLSFSPTFISAIGSYVGHLDQAIRRCGMLAAEVVAQRAGRTLDFGDWEGNDPGKAWARQVRTLLSARDVDAALDVLGEPLSQPAQAEANTEPGIQTSVAQKIVVLPTNDGYDSDDSLTGYASQGSSRSTSPTPEELAEIEKDPSLNVGIKKVRKPVYLAQLGVLVRNTGGKKAKDEPDEVDKMEMALGCAEELIRKKRDFGTELDENAVNLVHSFVALQDNFDLDGFERKRQAALTALVSCCPRKSAPCLIEEFFKNQYSIAQRFAMLNALGLGARELASLPLPQMPSSLEPESISFPSKRLPGALHQKYLLAGGQVEQITQQLARAAIDKEKNEAADKVPELARERRLRIRKPAKVIEVEPSTYALSRARNGATAPSSSTTYAEVATEYFVAPFVNRFWLFLRDEQSREERTSNLEGRQQYHGAGTGLILSPMILSHFLSTIAILAHAARNAPEWLAIVAPDALELAVTIGTRPISRMEADDDEFAADLGYDPEKPRGKQAVVLSASLELALIVLDGCIDIDGGRSLGLDRTTLLLGAGEWAGAIFSRLDDGVKVEGGGGSQEVRLRRAAAGVVLKVDEIASKWRRSMIDTVNML
ncbi:hypothetical protein HGRIS_013257 [Hohenbuehelia grisea]|uniref:Telomere length regulation protein conserved domain-containing protein n=1 Tax=Hohenbuehelia grisea TaxID=104357 RepID=A0ABR3IUY2_9AGAR